ncbi:MAG TPA: L-asparaginase [Clostridiales bacterium UBA8960]|nr:L-asparaginase [Clostridiales bacterium UBA8960]
MSVELVHVYRGDEVESIHRGDVVCVHSDGKIAFMYGDAYKRTFWRSSAKPFQIIPFVEGGGLEKYGITPKELALMTASHGGESAHLEVLDQILDKLGMTVDDLDCGTARPMHEGEYRRLLREGIPFGQGNNPCSGKHSGMLGLGLLKELPLEDYIEIQHPVQQMMLDIVSSVTELHKENIDIAIDGCGVPVFGLPIYNMALAYTKLDDKKPPENLQVSLDALKRIAEAMTENPYYVAGTDRLDTILMTATKGRILAKLGAESVYCMTIRGEGLGIAMKIEDGSYRALDAFVPDLLLKHELIRFEEYESIRAQLAINVYNHRKQVVGFMKSTII